MSDTAGDLAIADRAAGSAGTDSVETVGDEFFDALRRADEGHAVALATGLLDAGVPAEDVLLRIVVPAQRRVGQLWQTGAWSVAQEHAATCIGDRVVAAVGVRTRGCSRRGHVVLGCLDGEWHTLAPRIVGEVLRLHGWTVTFLGASVPPAHLVSFLHQHDPDLVALSAALPVHLPAAHRTIAAVQRTGTPVLAGGPGFGADGRWARRLGVDAWAATAGQAVALLDTLPWAARVIGDDDLPVVGSGIEYPRVRLRRGQLVVGGIEELRRLGGSGRRGIGPGLTDSGLDDDLGHVADFLSAAAYVHDPQVFADHVGWLASAAAHRGAAPAALHAVLDAFRRELHDLPFALSCLDAGHVSLDRAAHDRWESARRPGQGAKARSTAATRSTGDIPTGDPRVSSR